MSNQQEKDDPYEFWQSVGYDFTRKTIVVGYNATTREVAESITRELLNEQKPGNDWKILTIDLGSSCEKDKHKLTRQISLFLADNDILGTELQALVSKTVDLIRDNIIKQFKAQGIEIE